MQNALTVDVEDYFHPSEVQERTGGGDWDSFPSRVEGNVEEALDLLAESGVRATFFVLGWVAKRFPRLVGGIAAAGHEIGCHSFAHRLVYSLSPAAFRADTMDAVRAIEDAGGGTPRLYRAPSFSVTSESWWALDVLAECGFTHDSSVYPIVHDRYGVPDAPRHPYCVTTPSGGILEIPVATVQLSTSAIAPVGGGAYFRLLPYRYTAAGIRRLNERELQPACFYFHPWELDPDQPRLIESGFGRWRTYFGLRGVREKLRRLLRDFQFDRLTAVHPGPAPANSLDPAGR